MERNLQRWTF